MPGLYDDRKPCQLPSKPRTTNVGYTLDEVGLHCKVHDGWIVVKSMVYDITNFARHHPGWTTAGQTSTIIAIQRNLGKDCTDEFLKIHSRSAIKQLDDYMIGFLIQSSSHEGFDRLVSNVSCFLDSCRDVLRFRAVTRSHAQAVGEELCNACALHTTLWVSAQIKLHVPAHPPRTICEDRVIIPAPLQPTAVLLGPRLWGDGCLISTEIEIILDRFTAFGCFAFGVVPECAFQRDPLGSRKLAHTFDGFGRLLVPGQSIHKQGKILYGERLAEGDHLSLLVQPARGQGRRVKCSFCINRRSLGIAFSLKADQPFSPVVYIDAMNEPEAIRIVLPRTRASVVGNNKVPSGLMFNRFGPFLTTWLRVPADGEISQTLTVLGVKQFLADRLSDLGPSVVSVEQLELLIDGQFTHDNTSLMMDLITYRNGMHLQNLHWHIPHLTS